MPEADGPFRKVSNPPQTLNIVENGVRTLMLIDWAKQIPPNSSKGSVGKEKDVIEEEVAAFHNELLEPESTFAESERCDSKSQYVTENGTIHPTL